MPELEAPGSNRHETGQLSIREEDSMDNLLEDARWIISGMIYGFNFTWIPSSIKRNVEEELVITPISLISRGDPSLKVPSVVEENGFIYVQLEYLPDATQQRRLAGWAEETYPASAGSASVSVMEKSSRRKAVEAAIKEAVHLWIREREYNKPREVSGKIALTEFPAVTMNSGHLKARVRVRMILTPSRKYHSGRADINP